jgi:hypothetical protein
MGNIKKGKAFTTLEEKISELHANGVKEINLLDLKDMMVKISYDQYNKSLQGEDVAEELSDLVNSTSYLELNKFVNTVLTDHRTLQSDTFNLFFKCFEGWANNAESGNYDARNEGACKVSKMAVDAVNK